MQHDVLVRRCLQLVAQLNVECQWRLPSSTRQRYAYQIALCGASFDEVADAQLRAMLCYYHTEHALVEALRDPQHPDHGLRWAEWSAQIMRLLTTRVIDSSPVDLVIADPDDLTQEVLADLWRGLRTFRYQSRLQTWAFTVISNRLVRQYRSAHMRKRNGHPQSLEALLAQGALVPDTQAPSPEEVVAASLLYACLYQTLARHPDRRLTTIFKLWACEEQTLRVIGERLNLSVPRVHTLLAQALALLRAELSRQEWVDSARDYAA